MIHYEIITGDYSDNEKIRGYISYIDSIEDNYRKRIIKYIQGFFNDPITLFPDAVNAFNANKLFGEIPDMRLRRIDEFVDKEDEDDYLLMIEFQREEYMSRMGVPLEK